jgi:hypothetical protein
MLRHPRDRDRGGPPHQDIKSAARPHVAGHTCSILALEMAIERNADEEIYFAEVEAEQRRRLREELDDNARKLEASAAIATALATDDTSIAARVHALGFDGDTARVFDLLPLVHVAWADGKIQRSERAMILGLARARGLGDGSPALHTLAALLDERPTDAFFRQSLEVLRAIVARGGGHGHDIVQLCIDIAAASGGILGLGTRIGEAERAKIAEVSLALGQTAGELVARQLA